MLQDILIIAGVVVVAVFAAFYFLNRWASKKMGDQQAMVEKTKQEVQIFVIDKRRDRISNVNLPKAVHEAVPKVSKLMRMYFIQAKVGPRIMTLMCDRKHVFNAIPVKKNVKVELAGIYIVSVKGMKTEQEIKAAGKEKRAKAKEQKK